MASPAAAMAAIAMYAQAGMGRPFTSSHISLTAALVSSSKCCMIALRAMTCSVGYCALIWRLALSAET